MVNLMKLVSFDMLRTLKMKDVVHVKADYYLKEKESLWSADWLLFPEYWQVNSLVYGMKKRIFPSISTYHLGHDKIEMTRVLSQVAPAHIPYTEIKANTENNIEYIMEVFDYPFVAKDVRSSMGNGVYLIECRKDFLDYCCRAEVLYVQEYLPIDRDMRLVYVGDRVIAGYWRVAGEHSFKNNVAQGGSVLYDEIPIEAIKLVERIAKELDIDHAGFDVAYVDGYYYIFEFNVMFGTSGLLSQNIDYMGAIKSYLESKYSDSHKEKEATAMVL